MTVAAVWQFRIKLLLLAVLSCLLMPLCWSLLLWQQIMEEDNLSITSARWYEAAVAWTPADNNLQPFLLLGWRQPWPLAQSNDAVLLSARAMHLNNHKISQMYFSAPSWETVRLYKLNFTGRNYADKNLHVVERDVGGLLTSDVRSCIGRHIEQGKNYECKETCSKS